MAPIRHFSAIQTANGVSVGNVTSSGGPSNAGIAPIGAYVPQCAPDGGYAKTQCHGSTGHCWCVNDVGAQVGQKTRGTVTCT
ncbi:unnamed protein product [Medioppia subpectinata]|uniref:Thyroglobulin type-1 domain-containing protein n=1 Tax=Medioppia subpectinata TaxID=1979941 RepID=A0A7R9PXC0_9ACAR|nr:unnamed protein product [Medioppia subpectinata]CAG2104233.1 unnamed protein product [Medioppia subpectinata]